MRCLKPLEALGEGCCTRFQWATRQRCVRGLPAKRRPSHRSHPFRSGGGFGFRGRCCAFGLNAGVHRQYGSHAPRREMRVRPQGRLRQATQSARRTLPNGRNVQTQRLPTSARIMSSTARRALHTWKSMLLLLSTPMALPSWQESTLPPQSLQSTSYFASPPSTATSHAAPRVG